ncbi:MAG TPA: flagellar basal body-associated FliL family protein [Opitutaceae bacterium]|nr:flagellar basal body-associated FliL family protein [Opitutaceae bacterium]
MPPPPKAEAPAAAAKNEPVALPAAAAPAPAAPRGLMAWLPAIVTVLLAPVATWATVEFVLLPRLQKKIAAPPSAEASAESAADAKGEKGKDGKKDVPSYEFQNQVVNLAGTMGTRFLKTNIYIAGADPNIKAIFDGAKPKLIDITQSVLSSLTLADIEEPGSKNVIRAKLVEAYNQALNKKVVAEVYLTDFVIQ